MCPFWSLLHPQSAPLSMQESSQIALKSVLFFPHVGPHFSMIVDIISSSLGRATNMLTSLEEVSTTTRFILVDRIMIYLSVALLYYDWILTLNDEIEYLWLKPKSIVSCLILLTRYFPFSSVSGREHSCGGLLMQIWG